MGNSGRYPVEIDGGYVVRDENTLEYFCGLNQWDKQLRKAKIYHSVKYTNEVILKYTNRKLNVHRVIMRVEDIK